jgi:phage tail-like protein
MDVNGTKFHLIYGQADWAACLSAERGLPLHQLERGAAGVDYEDAFLQLYPSPPIFQQNQPRDNTPPVREGRGAAAGADGNIYSITPDGGAVEVQRNGRRFPESFWIPGGVDNPAGGLGDFKPYIPTATPPSPASTPDVSLRGVAVTSRHYLVVGFEPGKDDEGMGGLYLIPLGGGPKAVVRWTVAFSPVFITPTSDGKVWVLDTANQMLWWVDVERQLDVDVGDSNPSDFVPAGISAEAITRPNDNSSVQKCLLIGFDPNDGTLIDLATAPDGGVLVMVKDKDGHAEVWWYAFDLKGVFKLRKQQSFDQLLPDKDPNSEAFKPLDAVAMAHVRYDAACSPWLGEAGPFDVLLLMEKLGNQAIAVRMKYETAFDPKDTDETNQNKWLDVHYELLPDYLPIRDWSRGGLLPSGCRVWFDSAGVWTPVQRFDDRQYRAQAVIVTSPDFPADYAVQPFDGESSGCVWHRLLLDAVIPPGCRVGVRARAADDPAVLLRMPWLDQPALYRRGVSSELPWYTPPPFRAPDPADEAARQSLDPACYDPLVQQARLEESGAGAWELLFQEVVGRYIQLELTLEGTGRTTPELYALRAWYPRFSWLERYLPAIYREDRAMASFLERWLANFEGFFTELEGLIEHFPMVLDPRITPAEALEWLAGWMGLLLDPQWNEQQRRFFIRHAMTFYRLRGTPRGLEVALRLYLNDFSETMFREQQASWRIRLREGFRFALLFHNPPVNPGDPLAVNQVQCEAAHTFTVLIPPDLPADQRAMIERIVELEKPAHTRCDGFGTYAGQLVLDSVILGEDTLLCKPVLRSLNAEALPRVLRGGTVYHPDLKPVIVPFDTELCRPSADAAARN